MDQPQTKQPIETLEDIESRKSSSIVSRFFLISLAAVLLLSFLRFFVIKNYDIIIEESCDPATEICFTRDCSTGECPPNELSDYKQFIIKGFDFAKCNPTNTCAKFCSNPKNCEQIKCDGEAGDECVGPEIQTE